MAFDFKVEKTFGVLSTSKAGWNAAINIACRKHPITFKTPKDGALNFVGRLLSINQTLDLSGKLRNL